MNSYQKNPQNESVPEPASGASAAESPAGGSPVKSGDLLDSKGNSYASAASQPAPTGLDFLKLTDTEYERVAQLSAQVPVVIVFSATASNAAVISVKEALRAEERKFARKILLVEAEQGLSTQQLFAAFQVTQTPLTVALLSGRPVPLFAGAPEAEQIGAVIAQLMQIAKQNGIEGELQVPEDQNQTGNGENGPVNPAHEKALAAEAAQDWVAAQAAWEEQLKKEPTDAAAKTGLARTSINARATAVASTDSLLLADQKFMAKDYSGAMEMALARVDKTGSDESEAARARLVEYFLAAGNEDAATKKYRPALAAKLF